MTTPTQKQAGERTQRAQYGEGDAKFYADKIGPKTVATYKLSPEQRDEVNGLVEDAQNDLEAVLFKLVAQRDELLAACKAWEYARKEGGISMVDWYEVAWKKAQAAIAKAEGRAQ